MTQMIAVNIDMSGKGWHSLYGRRSNGERFLRVMVDRDDVERFTGIVFPLFDDAPPAAFA